MIATKKFSVTLVVSVLLLLVLAACGDVTPTAATTTVATTTATTTTLAATTTTAPATTSAAPTTVPATTTTVAPTTVPATTTTVAPTTAPTTTSVAPTATPVVGNFFGSATTAAANPTVAMPEVPDPTTTASVGARPTTFKIVVAFSDGSIAGYNSPKDFTNSALPIIAHGNSPVFSPDGTRIAYIALDINGDADANSPIKTVKLDGSDEQTLCTISYHHTNLIRWVPKPNVIEIGMLSIGVNTASACNVTNKAPQDSLKGTADTAGAIFDYSPDGKNFLWEELPTANDTFAELYYGSSTAKSGIKLTHGQYADSNDPKHSYTDAAISPDGKTIAVVGDTGGIFFLSVPGQTSPYANKLIFSDSNIWRMAWSPDGKQLLAVMPTDSGTVLRDYDFATGKVTPYTLSDVVFVDWARN